ncbi:PAS domain-containing protein [Rhodocyclus tenuis]|uniref:Signal transduction histidine kinase n=1 Tax=Rhodocyclus tenuis TaxID=1066 RepID=A0A840GG19_RHOTE|nr:PAS domain-containing protein [Rhodocyclus tenuis]MBB4247462.1 signal transduction histidine kinase [Rhodocyclus tenuis]
MSSPDPQLRGENQRLRACIAGLEAENERLRRLFSNDHVVMLQLDHGLRVRAVSPAASQLCELLPADCARPIGDFSEDRIGLAAADDAAEVLATARARMREMRLADGRWWLRQMFASRDAAGAIDGIVINYLDINDSKEKVEIAAAAQRRMAETLEERVEARTAQLRALSAELSLAEERERRVLATDLHDDLGQVLAIAKIKLSSMDDHERRGALKAALKEVESLVDHANRSVRSLMMQLSPPLLQTLGLPAALEWLAEEMERIYGISVRIDDDGQPKPLAEAARTSIFRAVRELLINVAKHSGARQAEVNCLRSNERITVAVTDHGSGFDYLAEIAKPLGEARFGLLSVRERIEFLGGEMNVDSTLNDGATITLTVPVTDNREEFAP